MSGAALLEARGITMRFGGVTAVDSADLTLGEAELRCLIGPNGAGKSTFFKNLTGQLTPTEGTVRFRGKDVTGANPHAIARLGVGIETQIPNVFNGLSVRENTFIGAARRHGGKQARAVVDETLARLQLEPIADRLQVLTAQVQTLAARVADLEAKLGEPPKTPDNSSVPPSQGRKPNRVDKSQREGPREGSLGRKGGGRTLVENPDETVIARPTCCAHCRAAFDESDHTLAARYDKFDLPKVKPVVTRVKQYAGRRGINAYQAVSMTLSGQSVLQPG